MRLWFVDNLQALANRIAELSETRLKHEKSDFR